MIPAEIRANWEAAYRRTEYRVELQAGDLVLRVDSHQAADDERLRRESGVQTDWAIVTPCNPGSQPCGEAENTRLLEELNEIVQHLDLHCASSINRDPQAQWPDEPGFLLCDPPPGFAEELGRHFRQNAILVGTLGEAPRLLWLE
ncbi:DUF3293 domain-containing protein [Nevskia soli]|uniref:DUF3293 domain-containing protein n=1 Tax=Nevskia soli TaxID=418856 RepID=UPI0004A6FEEC|nr:DUF3293 domain-containing protein [Nevskia soli]